MKYLDGLLKLVDNEFEAIEKNGKFRSREEIDSVYKLIDIAKDVYCIWKYEDESEGGDSEAPYDGRMYPNMSYDGGVSYARGRRNARRDSMGRYTSRDGGRSYRGISYDDGKSEYIDELRELMQNAPDDQTRQSIQRMISQMEQG